MATNSEKLGLRIRKLRKEANLTQEQLAEKAKVEPRSIVEIEAGKRNPTLKTISNIARALGVTTTKLLDD